MRLLSLCIFILFDDLAVQSIMQSDLYYVGTINNTLAAQMDLTFLKSKVSGHYTYDRVLYHYLMYDDDSLHINGTMTNTNSITLDENIHDEQAGGERNTGRFTGIVSPDRLHIKGNWKSIDGKHVLPFSLRAVAEYHERRSKRRHFQLIGSFLFFLNPSPAWQALNVRLLREVISEQQTFLRNYMENVLDSPQNSLHDY